MVVGDCFSEAQKKHLMKVLNPSPIGSTLAIMLVAARWFETQTVRCPDMAALQKKKSSMFLSYKY